MKMENFFFPVLQEASDCLHIWFSNIKPWKPGLVPSERFAWVKVSGVPVHAWSVDFFKFLPQIVGKFERVDNYTSKNSRLDVGMVLVTSSTMVAINRVLEVKIISIVYPISLVEEVISDFGHTTVNERNSKMNSKYSFEGSASLAVDTSSLPETRVSRFNSG